jgi:hypothetical protein
VAGFCENDNIPSDSTDSGKVIDYLNDNYLLKQDSSPRS